MKHEEFRLKGKPINFPPIPEGEMQAHTRVIITCKGGFSLMTIEVSIPFQADPEIALKDRLAQLRSSWKEVSYITRIAS